MIKIFMSAKHPFFAQNYVKEFQITIDNVLVTIGSKDDEMHMHLQGEVSVQIIENVWADVFSIVALYLGAYPQITMMKENNEIRDFSRMVVKYNSWNYMMKDYLAWISCRRESFY